MKIHRFITDFKIKNGNIVIENAELVKQIKNVLKLKVGEKIILGDGNVNEVLGEVTEIGKNIMVKVIEEIKNENEPKKSVTLYCSILKKENFEWVVQKATEVGIKEIVPIITKRTVKLNLNQERLEKIIKEAAEQSGRGIVPILQRPLSFEQTLENSKQNQLNLFFDESGSTIKVKRFESVVPKEKIGIFIGPEGGWDEGELMLAIKNNFEIVSLGKLTLRAETATIIASYLTINS